MKWLRLKRKGGGVVYLCTERAIAMTRERDREGEDFGTAISINGHDIASVIERPAQIIVALGDELDMMQQDKQ